MTHFQRTDAEALATFVRRLRPDWNHAGIVAAVMACHTAALSEAARALIAMAEDGTVQTPGLLNTPGKWWSRAGTDDRPAGENLRNRDMCALDGHNEPRTSCSRCAADRGAPARDETIAAAKAAARQAAADARAARDAEARRAIETGRTRA